MKPNPIKPLQDTKVEDVLTEKQPAVHPDDTLHTAGERMREAQASDWPVADGQKLMGTMDHPDPDRSAARFGHDPKATLVSQTMSRDIAFCYEDQSCAEALATMDEHQVQFLPVLHRDQRIAGIISRQDLLTRCKD